MTDYTKMSADPLCNRCAKVMDCVEDTTGFECDTNEAWHTILCKCPVCGEEALFWEVFAKPHYQRLETVTEGQE